MKRKIFWIILAFVIVVSLLAFPASAEETSLTVPQKGSALRQLVVQYAQEMAQVEWICGEDIDFTNAVSWSPELYYQKAVWYRGLPYTSDMIAGNAGVEEFSSHLNGMGRYEGPTSWNEMPGTDCGGIVRLAYGWGGALSAGDLDDMVFDPGDEAWSFGLKPLGDYDWTGYVRSGSTARDILEPNGHKIMNESYAKLREGDCVFVLYPDNGEHIMLAVESAIVYYNGEEVDGSRSFVTMLEQNSNLHNFGGYMSNWKTTDYTFDQLFAMGFIPMTMEAYSKDTVETPVFQKENINISGKVGFHDLMSGRIVSNYNMFSLEATITDTNGKVLVESIAYPYSLRGELAQLDYGQALVALPAGDYHYTLKATIGFGTQTVVDTDITYTGCKGAPTVFISDKGTGNGSSAEEALGNTEDYYDINMSSYKNSAFHRAVNMLSTTGGTIVICDDVTLLSGRCLTRYTGLLSGFAAPEKVSDQIITLTSVDGRTDYRKEVGAELILQRSFDQATDLELNIGSVWKDLDFRVEYDFAILPVMESSAIGAYVSFGGRKTVIEDTVSVTVSNQGKTLGEAKSVKYLPKLYGAYYNMCSQGTTDLTVLGGSWREIIGANQTGHTFGGTNVTVGGNAVVYEGITGGSASRGSCLYGDVNLMISGGRVRGKIVAGSGGKMADVIHNISFKITGYPDLSGLRAINAGTAARAQTVVLDMSQFLNADKEFDPYVNVAGFTEILEAPPPQDPPIEKTTPVILIVSAVCVSIGGAVVAAFRTKAAKAQAEENK